MKLFLPNVCLICPSRIRTHDLASDLQDLVACEVFSVIVNLLSVKDSSFDPKAGEFVVLDFVLVVRPRVGERVDLVGLEVAQDLRVDELVLEPRPVLHDRVDGVDLQQLVGALHLGLGRRLQ